MEVLYIILLLLAAIIIIGIIWYISTRNNFVTLQIKVDESESGIDVALEKRYDLLTKSISAVEKYMEYEKSTLEQVTNLRAGNVKQKNEADKILTDLESKLNITLEAYPELKADKAMADFQENAKDVENHLQASRRFYNSNVTRYNTAIRVFPGSIVANQMALTEKEFFETTDVKKQDVKFS